MQSHVGSAFPAHIIFDDVDPAELALEDATSPSAAWEPTRAWRDYVRKTLARASANVPVVSAGVLASVEGGRADHQPS